MAFTPLNAFTFDHTAQLDYPDWTPAEAKTNMNARGEELRLAFNVVVALLNSATLGASGSESIASPTIAGIAGNTVYAQIANLLAIAQAAQAGAILPGTITDAMLATDAKVGSLTTLTTTEKASVVGAINEIDAQLTADLAKFKKGSSSFTDDDTEQTFTDAFCTADSLVTVSITSATTPQGVWSVESAAGEFTITSTVAESADITFDYFIQKVV